jgi:hypothetical protein
LRDKRGAGDGKAHSRRHQHEHDGHGDRNRRNSGSAQAPDPEGIHELIGDLQDIDAHHRHGEQNERPDDRSFQQARVELSAGSGHAGSVCWAKNGPA